MIQNGYALEQRSGWVEAGRQRVGKGMEGERCVGLETGRGRIAVRGFGEPGRRYNRYMHSQHLHSADGGDNFGAETVPGPEG